MESHSPIIKKLHDRSQLVIGLLLFFPVTIGALFGTGPAQLSGNMSILSWGSVIGIFILDYMFLELLGDKIVCWIQKTVNFFLLIEICSFGIVLVALSLLPKGGSYATLSFYKYAYVVGLGCLTFIPLVILIAFTLNFVYLTIHEIIEGFKRAQPERLAEQAYLYSEMEIRKQCMFAMAAFANITKKGEGETPITFSSIHSFLTHCANISKILWSPKPNPKHPGATLKEAIGENVADRLHIGGSSPIKVKKYRDTLDHYDERIVKWVKEALIRKEKHREVPIVDMTIGKKTIADALYLRHYDPETGIFTLMSEELNLKTLHDEVFEIEKKTGGPLMQR